MLAMRIVFLRNALHELILLAYSVIELRDMHAYLPCQMSSKNGGKVEQQSGLTIMVGMSTFLYDASQQAQQLHKAQAALTKNTRCQVKSHVIYVKTK